MKRDWPLKPTTQGFRPRQDQWERLLALIRIDPELTPSSAIRTGLDMFIRARELEVLERRPAMARQVFQSIAVPLQSSEGEKRKPAKEGKSRTPGRKARRAQHGSTLAGTGF